MTIQELYVWAKENNILDYDISIELVSGDFGIVDISDMRINEKREQAIIANFY